MLPAAILFDLDDTLISPHLHRKTFWNDSICQIWEETSGSLENRPKNLDILVDQIDNLSTVFLANKQVFNLLQIAGALFLIWLSFSMVIYKSKDRLNKIEFT